MTSSNLELDSTGKAYLEALARARSARKVAETEERRLAERVRALLGSAETGSIDGLILVQRTPITTRRFDTKAFASDHPDLYDEYRAASTHDRLDIADDLS